MANDLLNTWLAGWVFPAYTVSMIACLSVASATALRALASLNGSVATLSMMKFSSWRDGDFASENSLMPENFRALATVSGSSMIMLAIVPACIDDARAVRSTI